MNCVELDNAREEGPAAPQEMVTGRQAPTRLAAAAVPAAAGEELEPWEMPSQETGPHYPDELAL